MASTQSATGWVYPEDSGTNSDVDLEGSDWNDAGNFAAAFYAIGLRDVVVSGLDLTPDYTNRTLQIGDGAAIVSVPSTSTVDHAGDGSRGPEPRSHGASFIVQLDEQRDLPLDINATNHVFVTAELTTADALSVHIDTNNTPPKQSSLKLGEVDMNAQTVTETNRHPTLTTAEPTDPHDAVPKQYVDAAGGTTAYAETKIVSGDGSTKTFSFSHDLGSTPDAVTVTPASEDASTDWWLSGKDSASIDITYAAAPAAGTDNLVFEVMAVLA